MAEKKSWRDYSKNYSEDKSTDKSANEEKTGGWRDYSKSSSSDTETQSREYSSSWRDYSTVDTGSIVGNNVVNRVNKWLNSHNEYLKSYQDRYSGRKGGYEDDYVSDSADWLETVKSRQSSLSTEADDILSYLDQYKDYFNSDWVNEIKSTLQSAKSTHGKIIDSSIKDNMYWESWGSDDFVTQYGSAQDAYKAHQLLNANTGKSTKELDEILAGMEDSKAKELLSSYRASVDYDEKSKYDIAAAEKELAQMEAEAKELATVSTQYSWLELDDEGNWVSSRFTPEEIAEISDRYAYFQAKYDGKNPGAALQEAIKQKKEYLEQAKRVQDLNSLSSVTGNDDFAQNSQYVNNVEYGLFGKPEFTDNTYAFINNPTVEDKRPLGAGDATARELINWEHAIYSADSPIRNRDSSYVRDALEYMTEDEVKIYNYYYATEGAEKANEYLDLLVNTFKERKYADAFEKAYKLGSEHPILASIASVATSIGSASEYLGDVVQYGADKIFGKDATLDKNELAMTTGAIRGGAADTVDWKIGNWDAFDFVYNTAMSGIDSLTSTMFGGAGGVVLGLSAAAQGTNDALERGMSDGQAFWNGLFSGAFEGIFESFSIGNFNKLKEIAPNGIKDIFKNLGKSMLVNASEETLTEIANIAYDTLVNGEFANYTMEELRNGAWKQALTQVIEAGASGALMGVGMSAVGSAIGNAAANKEAKVEYSDKTDTLIQEGLKNDVNSKSYQLATKYQQKVGSNDGNSGKTLTGQQIRKLLAANQEVITANDMQKIQQAAEKRLTAIGQTEDVSKLAELATRYATGQELTRAEKSFLANSTYGARVAKELLPENILSDERSGKWTTDWAEEIGTESVNKAAYNKKAIRDLIDAMASAEDPATYKPLEERAGTESSFKVSKDGQATIRKSGETIDLHKAEVAEFVKDKNGNIVDMVIKADGKEVKASEIDYADGDQSYLFEAVSKIENISAGAATAIIRDYDPSSGQTVGEYLNGIDEGFTYGYYGYTEADLKAGNFTTKLTDTQMKSAYVLGQYARQKSVESKTEAHKNMRTAAQAEAEKAVAEGKEAPKDKNLTITYNEGGGKVVSIDKAGIKDAKRSGAVEVAKILHKLGLGTKVEFFKSYLSKDENGNEIRVFKDDNGVEQRAYSGVYRKSDGTIRIDLDAYNGRGLTLNALSHELTHFIQQWSDEKYKALADFLIKAYEKTDMTMHERVLREQARLEGIRGEKVSYDEAFNEVVANAMSKMFDDGKLVERLTELKAQDEKLAKKLWQGFKKILAKFLGIYEEAGALFHDAADLMAMKETFEQLQNMFAEAMVEASGNYQASLTAAESQTLTEAGIGFDVETKSVYSLHFSNAYTEQIQVGKKTFDAEAISKLVSKVTGRSIEDARAWVKSEMAIANIVMQNPEFLDFEADNRYEAIKKNSDYPQGTVDLSNLCPKREEFTTMFDMLQKKYPNKLFTAQDVADMRKILSDNDITVACGACFVEDRRQLIGEIADTFIGMWKEAVDSGKPLQKTNAAGNKIELQVTKALAKQYGLTAGAKIMATDTYIPNQYDLTTYEGFKKLEKNHPTIAMAFNRYNNSRGQQSARLIEGRAEYKRQILGWSDAKVKSVNNNGGLRIFSFSDFEVVHLLDLVQVIIDCAAKGVKIQGYTKIPAFAKLVRETGIKLNRSLIPKGDYGYHMENGKVVLDYDTTEGIDIKDKNFIDESANPNVGNIVIGINPTQIGAAMLDPFIDYIIPFHSNKAKDILRKLGTGEWVNYKESQHEKDIATGTSSKHNVNIYTEVINKYHPKNKVEFVDAFLKECKRQGKIPRYAEFLNVDANGDYAYREGYHKLLVDFKMFDAEGNILPQGNITPKLNEGFMKELLNAEIDKKQNYKFPQEVYDAIDKKFGGQFSSQETDIDTDADLAYDGVKNKTAQEDKANGRREEVSHGGNVESQGEMGKENSGRKSSERESCERRIKEILRKKAFRRDNKSTSGRGRVELRETRESFENRSRRDGLMYVEVGGLAIACKVAPEVSWNENTKAAAEKLSQYGFDVVVFTGEMLYNIKDVTELSVDGITVPYGDSLTIFISADLAIDGMETAYHEAFHATTNGKLAKYHGKIANIIASNVDFESKSFEQFVSVIADLYTYTVSDVSASKFEAEVIEEFYAWYVGKAYATQSGDMQEYMEEFSDVETIKSQIDDVYAQMEADADKALHGLLEGNEEGQSMYSSQETDQDGNTMTDRAKEILASAKPKMIGKNEKADIEFDTVRELFNELNADKDIQALADMVFKVAKEDHYGHYGYSSYYGEPKSHLRLPMAFVGKSGIPDGVHGQFRKNTIWGDIVFSYEYFMDDSVAPQSKASTILHEVIHAITCSHIESAYRWLQAKHGMFADPLSITDLDGVDDRIKAGIQLIDAFEQVRSAPTKDGKNLYGQLTAYEMVAEMANVEFRNFLKKQNLWNRIVDAIKRIFGIPNTTAYDAVSDALERILVETTNDADVQRAKALARKDNNRYSEHDTDYSNRSLLANAFEGITQNSNEYKMIQEYKGRIKILNEYEEKLSKLNAEIREIRFTEGKYDAKKLRQLEAEAKKVAENINRNDKKLLSMEASEPLRKVIERERKKEAQKTRDHVKEIQKNKKARAEQTELRHKIRKTIRDLDKILNRGNKKQNVKEDMKGFVSKALELADYLFTDHVSNDDLIRNGITVRMTKREAALVKETEDILSQIYDNFVNLTAEEFARLDAKRKSNMDKLRDLLTAQRNERLNTPVYNLFNDLVTEYAALKNSKQEAVKAAYDPNVERFLREYMGESNGETDSDRKSLLQNMRVADMTTKELEHLLYAYTMVMTSVRDANKLHIKGKTETIEQMAGRIMGDFSKRKAPDGKVAIALRNLSNKMGWDYEKLYYALDRIGSEAFAELVMNIANSENIVMQDVMEAAAFRDEMVKNYGFNNWDVNKKIDREFLDNTGKKFKMTLGQMMALYAYSRRDGAWDHIEYGGFVFGEAELTNPKPADSYKLSKAQCEAITNLLTKEQKGYVEDMQKFLSETMGAKGNEVSMQLYGIKMFTEKNYFPIHIAGQFKAQANESQAKAAAGFSSMSNAGFTHAQNPNAKAPFVLEGFNDVWADHVNEMSRYHGTVPALEDMRKVMNRSSYSESGMESMSVKQMMENSFGKEAVDYFDNLYREANSGAITDKLQKWPKKLLSLFRKNSVAYSLSVLVQQPASLVRAYAVIDRKYFGVKGFGAITSGVAKAVSSKWSKAYSNAYNEMLQYAPGVTMAKEIGGFDTATGGSIRSYLLDTGKSFKQSMKTENLKGKAGAVMDLVDDNAIANLPSVADKIAWIEIWNACKRETVAKHKDLATSSEEFMQIVGERFTEVIRATQVYDSIFAKSPMLKSKNLAVQYLVSFMNEPNTTANMVEKAMRDITKGNWKSGVRTATVVIHSIIFTNVLKSIIYAMRDDDEDETYIEKYLEAISGGLINDFTPFNYIPIARDVWSLAQGYDVERADMAIVSDALDSLNRVIKNAFTETDDMTEEELAAFDKKVTEANWKLVESLASFLGIPVKNIRREIDGVLDHAKIASANAGMTTSKSVWDKVYDSVIDSIPFMSNKHTKADKLYEAIISGDQTYVERLKSTYKDDDAYHAAVRKVLRENDPRIHEAAQARYDGNIEEYKRVFREIQKEGKFTFDDIMSAVNSEVSAIRNKLEPDKVTSQYSAGDFVESVAMDNITEAQAMRENIIATKVANGKTQEEAEKEFASDVATDIGKAYSAGLLDEAQAKKMLVEYAGKDEEEAVSKVSYWAFCEEHSEYKDVLTEANVAKYHEFAEPAKISVEVYAQFITGTKGLETKYDKWGDVEVTKREQVLEVIDSLVLTWKQKDALYLAAGYAESQIWDVPW